MKFKKNKIKKPVNNLFIKIICIVGILFVVMIGNAALIKTNEINKTNIFSFINEIKTEKFASETKNDSLKDVEKINVLITGMGGGKHDAPDLTDTIIMASYNTKKHTVTMLSIPRDLYVKNPFHSRGTKINEVYLRGLLGKKTEEESIKGLMDKVSQITGEEINYYVNINFSGFVKIINTLGGIEIDVPKKIYDTTYPNNTLGYTTFSIDKGLQVLDGETALKYARSRHSTSDFDRSLRQQLIIEAIRDKIVNLNYLSNPMKIKGLYFTIKESVKTNFTKSQIIKLALLGKDIKQENIRTYNLNDTCYELIESCRTGGFLYTPLRDHFYGMSVLLPFGADAVNPENYTSIQKYTNIIFNYPEVGTEQIKIGVQNSTGTPGLAYEYAINLRKYGFNTSPLNVGNTNKEKFEKTKIFYNNIKPESPTLEALSFFIIGEKEKTENTKYNINEGNNIEIVIGDNHEYLIY